MDKKVSILGVGFTDRSLIECTEIVNSVLRKEKGEIFHIITANPEIVMQINRDKQFKKIQQLAGMITADGIGIVFGAKILGKNIQNRVTGVEFLVELLDMCQREGHSVFFLGATKETNQKMEHFVVNHYPSLRVAGFHHGYFDQNHDHELLNLINDSHTDFLVLALGSPRSHKWFDTHRNSLKIKAVMDVGGGFDALTGTVRRAPRIIRQMNLEWFYRRLQNPERAKRQKDLYYFVFEVFKERFRKVKKYG